MIVGDQAPWPYDITLSGRGFMLTRVANEMGVMVPSFIIKGQRQIQERLDTGDLAGVFGSPEAEVPWTNQDFSGGMGLREQIPGIVNRYYYASNVDLRIPLKAIGGPALTTHTLSGSAGTVRAMAVMYVGTTWTLFVGVGRNVFSSTDGVTFSLSKDLGASRVVTSMVVFQGTQSAPVLFVGVTTGQKYWTYTNAGGWVEETTSEAEYFVALQDELWRASVSSNIWYVSKSTVGGANLTWGTNYIVGDANVAVTEMVAYDDRAYVFTENQIYTLQRAATSITAEVWPGGLEMKDALNGVGSAPWASRLYMVLPDAGLYEYTLTGSDQFVQPVGPDLLATNDSTVRGPVTAVCGERDYWLYAAIQNESSNSFLMAWDRSRNAWHGSLVDLGAFACRKMIVTDKITTNPRLFIGLGANVASIILPRAGRDRSQDANCTFASTGSLYLARFTANFPFIDKSMLRGAILATGLDASNTILYNYRILPTGSFTALGSAWTAVPQSAKRFPTTGVKSAMLDSRIDFVTGTTATPALSSFVLLYNLRPEFKRRFEFTVRLGDQIPLNDPGTFDSQTLIDLEDAVNSTADGGPVALVAPNGRSFTVQVDVEPLQRILRYQKGQPYEASYDLVAFEHGETNVKGTYKRMEAYTYGQLEAYSYGAIENL